MDDDDSDRTVWCGNLPDRATEEILYELFLQVGPIERITIPKDKDGRQTNYGFITFKHVGSVNYALSILEGTALYDRTLLLQPRNRNKNGPISNSIIEYSPSGPERQNDLQMASLQGRWTDRGNFRRDVNSRRPNDFRRDDDYGRSNGYRRDDYEYKRDYETMRENEYRRRNDRRDVENYEFDDFHQGTRNNWNRNKRQRN